MAGSNRDSTVRSMRSFHSGLPDPHKSALPASIPVFVALLSITGCSVGDADTAENANMGENASSHQTAYRVRSDFDAALNADNGWAGKTGEDVSVNMDAPFRLRFELVTPDESNTGQPFQLQSRRNGGEWQRVGAENFPLPEKATELNFEEELTRNLDAIWQIDQGDASALEIAGQSGDSYLKVTASDGPVLAIGQYETTWEPVEFAVKMRLPEGGTSGAGVVFGYVDSENYNLVFLDPTGVIVVTQVEDGTETRVAGKESEVPKGKWVELKIVIEDEDQAVIEYELDDDETMSFTAELGATIPSSAVGFNIPANGAAEFQKFTIEGQPRTPLVSIMSSDSYQHGQPTEDLLQKSDETFTGGAGISFADRTPSWSGGSGQSEWEWPLVIRHFADGAITNNDGDTYEFRMANANGKALDVDSPAKITAALAPGHLGGTFVETPGRIGPWQAGNGDLYFLMEPSETYNVLMTVKSEDKGKSWQEIDGDNRPETGDLEGFSSVHSDDTIHMLHQTSNHVWYHAFRTSDHPTAPDTWSVQDERLASPVEPPTQVADIAMRSDGSIVAVYGGPEKIHFRIRSADGTWGEETVIDEEVSPNLSGPMLVRGKDDVVHLAYTGSDGTAWYRRIRPDGELTQRQRVATGLGTDSEDIGSILPLVYLPETDTLSIIYRLDTGILEERRSVEHGPFSKPARVSDHSVVQNAVDADQTGADAIADGTTVHVLYIEEDSRHIFHTSTDGDGSWSPVSLQVEDVDAQWVRGTVLDRGESGKVLGYVYDAGSNGGSGMNRYEEISLDND